mgnify:FL=1
MQASNKLKIGKGYCAKSRVRRRYPDSTELYSRRVSKSVQEQGHLSPKPYKMNWLFEINRTTFPNQHLPIIAP